MFFLEIYKINKQKSIPKSVPNLETVTILSRRIQVLTLTFHQLSLYYYHLSIVFIRFYIANNMLS